MRSKPASTSLSQAGALVMPFIMAVVVPWLLISGDAHHTSIWMRFVGLLLFSVSLVLFASTVALFVRIGKGTLAPWDPTRRIVVVGPYRYCRNPMISGVLGMILAEALFFWSTTLFLWGAAFFVVNTIYFVLSEEPGLRKRFGAEYIVYTKHVPRWLPRLTAYHSGAKGR